MGLGRKATLIALFPRIAVKKSDVGSKNPLFALIISHFYVTLEFQKITIFRHSNFVLILKRK